MLLKDFPDDTRAATLDLILLDFFSILEELEGGKALKIDGLCGFFVIIDVNFLANDIRELLCHLFELRYDQLAGSVPGGHEFNSHNFIASIFEAFVKVSFCSELFDAHSVF